MNSRGYPEGLAEERRMLTPLCAFYTVRLEPHGVTAEKLAAYEASDTALKDALDAATNAESTKEQLTIDEAALRSEVFDRVRSVQKGAKKVFGKNAPQLQDFHIGEPVNDSTTMLVALASNCIKAWTTYKDKMIAEAGVVQMDIDKLQTAADSLADTDAKQEVAKTKTVPEATAAVHAAEKNMMTIADFIHTAGGAEFVREPAILNQFAQAKKKRFVPPLHQDKPNDNNQDSGTDPNTPPPPPQP